MIVKQIFLLLLVLITVPYVYCQQEPDSDIGNTILELLNEDEDNAGIASEQYEELTAILQKKENINLVSRETLEKLPFITAFQIHAFIEYRNKYGKIFSSNELRLITGFHDSLVKKFILLFDFGGSIYIKSQKTAPKSFYRHQILSRIKYQHPLRAGFSIDSDSLSGFIGKPIYRLFRYEIKNKDKVRAGFTLESDPGEPIVFDSIQNGFNLQSGYIEFKGIKYIDRIILGDYKLTSAGGLIYSYGRNGKSSGKPFISPLPELKKYSSTSEAGFYRGLSMQLTYKFLRTVAFYSSSPLSTTIYSDSNDSEYFKSVYAQGYFRNKKERSKYHNARKGDAGIILSRTSDRYQIGYAAKKVWYNKNYNYMEKGDPHSKSLFTRAHYYNSVFYNLKFARIWLSAELAAKNKGGIAFQQKVAWHMHPLFNINLAYRYFSPRYFCHGAGGLSESSGPGNEKGFFTKLIVYPASFLKISAYIDVFEYLWIDYMSTFPVRGNDFMINTEWYLHSNLDLRVFFKTEGKDIRSPRDDAGIRKMMISRINRFYIQYTWKAFENLFTRFRFETKINSDLWNSGILLYQELTCSFLKNRLKCNLRYTLFDIPDWNLRIYSWEHDLLYSFSSPSYYKKGQNVFLNVRFKPFKNMSIGFKISATSYGSVKESGNSVDYRKGTRFLEGKGQVVWVIR